jgi:hypothetical protein
MDKAAILKLIEDTENRGKVAFMGTLGEKPPLGYARVIIHRNPDARNANTEMFACVNGLACLIKRGVEADIPIKILRGSLMTAVTTVNRFNENERDVDKRYYEEDVYSYPFTVLMITEGKDPKHYQHEEAQRRKNKNKKIFWRVNGYYPKPKELREWIAGGGLKEALEILKEKPAGGEELPTTDE